MEKFKSPFYREAAREMADDLRFSDEPFLKATGDLMKGCLDVEEPYLAQQRRYDLDNLPSKKRGR